MFKKSVLLIFIGSHYRYLSSCQINAELMFFKYLLSESDLNGAAPAAESDSAEPEQAEPAAERRPTQQRAARPSRQSQQAESSRPERGGDRVERADRGAPPSRTLSETQRAYLDTLKSCLSVNIDGDWDDDMIKLAFDRLERLFDRVRRG